MYPHQQNEHHVPVTYQYITNYFPQTSDSAIHPPVTNPLAYSTTPSAFAAQTTNSQNCTTPSAFPAQTTNSQNWILKHADPSRYDYVVVPIQDTATSTFPRTPNMQALVPLQETPAATFPAIMNDGWSHPYVTNEATLVGPEQSRVNEATMVLEQSDIRGEVTIGAIVQEPESKEQKILNGGLKCCEICNVKCTSQDMYEKHIAGRKHRSKVARMSNNGVGPSNNPTKKIKLDQSISCEVCKCECNSNEMYNTHIVGKKHLKNMKKLSMSKTEASVDTTTGNNSQQPANLIIGPQEKPDSKKPESLKAPEMEIATKKRKLVEGGAAKANVTYCSLCDVACNSQKQFDTHLTGQKHTLRVKKQRAESNGN